MPTGNGKGRDTIFTTKLGAEICKLMSSGKSIRTICRDKKMPHRNTIKSWIIEGARAGAKQEFKDFLCQYRIAESLRCEEMFEELIDIADHADPEETAKAKHMTNVRMWTLSRLFPTKYGDKNTTDLNIKSNGAGCDLLADITKKYLGGGVEPTEPAED